MTQPQIENRTSEIVNDFEAERRLYRAVKAVAETPEGKALLEWLCEMVEYGGTAFRETHHQTVFALGRQDPVNRIMHIVATPMDVLLERVDAEEAAGKAQANIWPDRVGGERKPFGKFDLFK